ncbi:MAG: FAD-dependent oxidoreductase [Saprospiraceae bacterium]
MKEVVIVGGGIVGLCCAWYLIESGLKVTIVDKGTFSDGCSFGNSGMIVPSHFIPLASPGMISKGLRWMLSNGSPFYIRPRLSLELAQWLWLFYRSANKNHVLECAPLLRDMHLESREFYDQLNGRPGFNFHFENKGILMMYQSGHAEKEEVETAEMAQELGIRADKLTPSGLQILEPGIKINARGAIHYPGDAHLAPHNLMQQMILHLKQSGGEFLTETEVQSIGEDDHKNATLVIKNGDTIKSKIVVIAAGCWSGQLMQRSGFRLPMQDGKGYSMTMQRSEGMPSVPSILIEPRVAITPMGDQLRIAGTLEISGMDEKINQAKVHSIRKAASDYYPDLKIDTARSTWYGYRPCPPDGMPYIGRLNENSPVILATGHAMMGLSLAPCTGRMIRDIIIRKSVNKKNDKFDPARFA